MDQRRKPQPVDPKVARSIIDAAVEKWATVKFFNGSYVDEARGWLGICQDSDEIVLEGDGGAMFVRIPTLISVAVD